MPQKNFRRRRPARKPRMKKADRTKLLVDGKTTLSRAENMLKNGASIASTVYALAKAVGAIQKGMNAELKTIDVPIGPTSPVAIGNVHYLSPVAQGTDDINRIGNSIKLQKLSIRMSFYNVVDNNCINSAAIVVDKDFDGTAPTWQQVFQTSNALTMNNIDHSKRFVVLKRHVFSLSKDTSNTVTFQDHIDLPFHAKYDGPLGALSDGKENQIFLLVFSNDIDLTYSAYSRISFTDD